MTWKNRKACQQYVGNDTQGKKKKTSSLEHTLYSAKRKNVFPKTE